MLTRLQMQAVLDQQQAHVREWAREHFADLVRLMDMTVAIGDQTPMGSDEGRVMAFALLGMAQVGLATMEEP